jgi:hypothetical protein
MEDALKKLREDLARQDKLASFFVDEWTKLKILPSDELAQLTTVAGLTGLRAEGMRVLPELPNIQDLYPLKHIQDALASIRFVLPEPPKFDFSALHARMGEIGDLAATFSQNLEDRTRLLLNFAPPLQHQSAIEEALSRVQLVEQMNFELPELAMLEWSPIVASQRLGLIEDSLSNVAALQEVQASLLLGSSPFLGIERIEVATELVWNHGKFLRQLPPTLRDASPQEDYRAEELGPKLEIKLREIDPRLVELRRESWKNLGKGKAGARLAAHGIREVFGELLRLFAPDEKVKQTDIWIQRKELALPKPTRRMRFEYIVGPSASDLAALIQFDESVQHANKFAHVFADDVEIVRVHLAQLEACIYLVLTYAMEQEQNS